ncbi:SMI1/KNR4 family protein [Verrucomicrobiota bacterium sgz303538]
MTSHTDLVAQITDQIAFIESIGGEVQCWTIEQPASEAQILAVEEELGFAIPSSLRRVFGNVAAAIDFDWVHLGEHLEDHDLYVAKGAVNWNLARLPHDLERARKWPRDDDSDWATVWRSTLPVIDVGCGDYIGVSLTDGESVVYLNHEAPDAHGEVIAPDFETFLAEWGALMFPGPDYGYWEAFLDGPNRYISSRTQVARDWRRWLAGELLQ